MKLRVLYFTFLFILITTSFQAQYKIGIFDGETAIGNPKLTGSATFNATNQTYTLTGAGSNMWFGTDEFQYLWTTIQGDFILRATVKFNGGSSDPHRKTGWIIKNSLDTNSAHVNASIHGDGLTSLQYRKTVGGLTEELKSTRPIAIIWAVI